MYPSRRLLGDKVFVQIRKYVAIIRFVILMKIAPKPFFSNIVTQTKPVKISRNPNNGMKDL